MHYYDEPGTYNVCLLVQDTDLECNSSLCQEIFISTTSTGEVERNKPLLIYPNPANAEDVSWNISGILETDFNRSLPIKIYDLSGKTILADQLIGENLMQLHLGQRLARSIYFIEIKGEQGVYRAKVIVQ